MLPRLFGKAAVGIACSLLIGSAPARAAAWTLDAGQTLAIFAASYSGSNTAYDDKGRPISASAFRKFEVAPYVERGLTDDLTLIAQPVFDSSRGAGPPKWAYAGFESLTGGARLKIATLGDAVFAVQGLARIPGSTSAINPAFFGASAYEAEGRLLAGWSFAALGTSFFVDAQAGGRLRTGGNPGEALLDVTLGAKIFDHAQVLLQSFNAATVGRTSWYYPAARSAKLQPSVVYEFMPGWSVQAGAYATVAAQNASSDRGVVLALWRKW